MIRREDGRVLIWASEFLVESKQKKRSPQTRIWERQVEEESMEVDLSRENALLLSGLFRLIRLALG